MHNIGERLKKGTFILKKDTFIFKGTFILLKGHFYQFENYWRGIFPPPPALMALFITKNLNAEPKKVFIETFTLSFGAAYRVKAKQSL